MANADMRPGDDVLQSDCDREEQRTDHSRRGQQPYRREQEHEDPCEHQHRSACHGRVDSRELDDLQQNDHNDDVHGDDDQDQAEDQDHEEEDHDDAGYYNPVTAMHTSEALARRRHERDQTRSSDQGAGLGKDIFGDDSMGGWGGSHNTHSAAVSGRSEGALGSWATTEVDGDRDSLGGESQGTDFETNGEDGEQDHELGWGQPPLSFPGQRWG